MTKKGERPETKEDLTLMTMELFEVTFNAPIAPSQFIYNPGRAAVTDQTEEFLQSIEGKK